MCLYVCVSVPLIYKSVVASKSNWLAHAVQNADLLVERALLGYAQVLRYEILVYGECGLTRRQRVVEEGLVGVVV